MLLLTMVSVSVSSCRTAAVFTGPKCCRSIPNANESEQMPRKFALKEGVDLEVSFGRTSFSSEVGVVQTTSVCVKPVMKRMETTLSGTMFLEKKVIEQKF